MIPETCHAAVFVEPGKPLELRTFELPKSIEQGAALCKVIMSTICGSDIHTISGRRIEPTPLILGHEIIGKIVELGAGLEYDRFGNRLEVGDRVSWSIMASCGQCFYCRHSIPQKCEKLRKYGHTCCNQTPYLTGGYAEYIYLFPGTAIYKIPVCIPDEIATPANCALSTVINAVETIGINQGESILIQGAGLLGLNLIALAKEAGARVIIVTDVVQNRLELASKFGASIVLNAGELSGDEIDAKIKKYTDDYGVDVAFEVCGASSAAAQAAQALRIGGRYLICGLVTPGSNMDIDGNTVTRKYLTMKGIHNYHPDHLGEALKFLEQHSKRYPYSELVKKIFPLSDVNKAITLASTGKHIRVAIRINS